jgi:hypothetical protein
MFTLFMKNIFTKNLTCNIAKLGGYDKAALCWAVCISTSSYWIYEFLERERVQDKKWKDAARKEYDDDPSWYMDGGVEDNALVNSGIALPKSTVE